MGCGKSAWDDECDREIYSRKLDKINSIDSEHLIDKLDKIKEIVEKVNKETNNGSRYLFRLLDDLYKETNWEKWE